MGSLPRFVMMADTALRLKGKKGYYRDGGNWGVNSKIKDKKLISVSNIKHAQGIELVPCSYEEWKKDNGQYAPTNIKETED